MEKKYLLIIFILVVIIGFMGYVQFFQAEEQIEVGDVNFTLPNGFHQGTPNSQGDINITNGTVSIFIAKYDGTNVTPYINRYQDNVNKTNNTVSSSNFTIDDINVYKSVNEGTGSKHYWFVKNNNVYSIYVWSDYENIDNIIFDLIKSTDPSWLI